MSKNEKDNLSAKIQINWYPGHMVRTKRQIKELLPLVDFVIEVIDSRVPFSSKAIDAESFTKNKPRIYVFSKYDFCDKIETDKWIKKYKGEGNSVICLNLLNQNESKKLQNEIDKIGNKINAKRKEKGLKPKKVRGLVVGVPNSGKSTLINMLAKKKIAKVGNTPGFTKNLSWLNAGSVQLLDSPGVLWPKFSEKVSFNLASTSAIREEVLPIEEVGYYILNFLNTYYKDILENRYNLKEFTGDYENYECIGKKIGAIKGGEADIKRICKFILNDLRNANIKNITFDRFDENE